MCNSTYNLAKAKIEPDQMALKELLLAKGFVAYKWPSEKDKIPKSVVRLRIQNKC
jgi:hypothetical protein